jgi:hypothetical protein
VLGCPAQAPTLASDATIEIGTASGMPGEDVEFMVTLHVRNVEIPDTQNDISFAPPLRIAARATGKPDCRANPDLHKSLSGFVFQPRGCVDSNSCTTVRALVGPGNVDGDEVPIPDGAELYRCRVTIAADATAGSYPLPISNFVVANLSGYLLPADGISGAIVVEPRAGSPRPTSKPTITPTPTATATPCDPVLGCATPTPTLASDVTIEIGTASGVPGEDVEFAVMLYVRNAEILGAQNDIGFAPPLQIAARATGKPDCRLNPEIHKADSGFAFLYPPPECIDSNSCTEIRALVAPGFADGDDALIPDGVELYRCRVAIAADAAAGSYPLVISNFIASDADGNRVPMVGISGAIVVEPRR